MVCVRGEGITSFRYTSMLLLLLLLLLLIGDPAEECI